VIASDDDGCFDFSGGDEFVEFEAGAVAFAESEPADAAGETLEGDTFLGHGDPAFERFIFGKEFEDGLVGCFDIFGIAGEGGPSEGAAAEAELGSDECGDKSGEVECILAAIVERALTDVVAVVEGDRATFLQRYHLFDVFGHGVD